MADDSAKGLKPYALLKVPALRREASRRGLDSTGTKEAVRERLLADDARVRDCQEVSAAVVAEGTRPSAEQKVSEEVEPRKAMPSAEEVNAAFDPYTLADGIEVIYERIVSSTAQVMHQGVKDEVPAANLTVGDVDSAAAGGQDGDQSETLTDMVDASAAMNSLSAMDEAEPISFNEVCADVASEPEIPPPPQAGLMARISDLAGPEPLWPPPYPSLDKSCTQAEQIVEPVEQAPVLVQSKGPSDFPYRSAMAPLALLRAYASQGIFTGIVEDAILFEDDGVRYPLTSLTPIRRDIPGPMAVFNIASLWLLLSTQDRYDKLATAENISRLGAVRVEQSQQQPIVDYLLGRAPCSGLLLQEDQWQQLPEASVQHVVSAKTTKLFPRLHFQDASGLAQFLTSAVECSRPAPATDFIAESDDSESIVEDEADQCSSSDHDRRRSSKHASDSEDCESVSLEFADTGRVDISLLRKKAAKAVRARVRAEMNLDRIDGKQRLAEDMLDQIEASLARAVRALRRRASLESRSSRRPLRRGIALDDSVSPSRKDSRMKLRDVLAGRCGRRSRSDRKHKSPSARSRSGRSLTGRKRSRSGRHRRRSSRKRRQGESKKPPMHPSPPSCPPPASVLAQHASALAWPFPPGIWPAV